MTYYRTSQPYFPNCKPMYIPDKSDHCRIPNLCHSYDPFLNHCHSPYHSGHNPFYKNNCVPCQADCRPHYNHGHDPYYGNNHGHDTASWYHAHDSGNTVVLNVPPYWTVGTKAGIGTEIAKSESQDLGHGSTTGDDLL
ncbi:MULTISPECIES: hypothetical protein [unclassified Wolbachia]|uniref:hypothetical protein n=1 Tax=unclassified Wolbachia TaxID=2640676 RepID=UPI00222792FC|nr:MULTISPECIES: hypothetical protein [unclassified Wolbachia]